MHKKYIVSSNNEINMYVNLDVLKEIISLSVADMKKTYKVA